MEENKIKIYKVYKIENIKGNALLRQSILNWYMSDIEWNDKEDDKEEDTNYDLSTPIGYGRTAVAYRIIAQNRGKERDKCVLKLFFPIKHQCPNTDRFLDNNYKLINSNDREEFEKLLNGFIDSLETSCSVAEAYENKGGYVLLTPELAMTSKGVCLISDNKNPWDKTLDAHIKDRGINNKEDLIYVLNLIDRILSNDIVVYHEEYKAVHLDIKGENFLVWEIDIDRKTKTVRSLDLGSVRTIKELLEQKKFNLFESSPKTNSFELIEETLLQINKCDDETAAILLKQLDLLAVVKMLLMFLFGDDIFHVKREEKTAYIIVNKISKCLHGKNLKASFSTLHIAWLFQKMLFAVNRIESCKSSDSKNSVAIQGALSDSAVEETSNSLLNGNNILTLSDLQKYINSIIEILSDENCYKFNHANYETFDYLLRSNNISGMQDLIKLTKEKFGRYSVPPWLIIEHLLYS